jgi:hypothetical protein
MYATVSFRAFDIIQKIEFAEDEKKEENYTPADPSLAGYAGKLRTVEQISYLMS